MYSVLHTSVHGTILETCGNSELVKRLQSRNKNPWIASVVSTNMSCVGLHGKRSLEQHELQVLPLQYIVKSSLLSTCTIKYQLCVKTVGHIHEEYRNADVNGLGGSVYV